MLGECFEGCSGLTGITFPAEHSYWIGSNTFSGATNLRYIDMSQVASIREGESSIPVTLTVDRQEPDNEFYGVSNATIIYLPEGHAAVADEPNVVIGGTANSILLTDGWDFNPPVDIIATNGVTYDRIFEATRNEMTQPTGDKIVVTDENGNDVELDAYEVTGYTYTPQGYSVCLPYALTLTAENAKVFTPSTIQTLDGTITVSFTEVTDKQMEAYTPYYIVISGDDKVNMNTTSTTTLTRIVETTPWTDMAFEFKGTTITISNEALCAAAPAYILQSNGNWCKVSELQDAAYVPPFRAYFQATEAQIENQLITTLDAIALVDDNDNSTLIDNYNGKTVSVTLQGRTFYHDGNWNTLCLPFAVNDGDETDGVTFSGTPLEGATVLTLDNATFENSMLTLNFEEVTAMEPGKPYLVKWANDTELPTVTNPVFNGVTISNISTDEKAVVAGIVTFKGQYAPLTIGDDGYSTILYLGSDNTFHYPDGEMDINAFRAYIHANTNLGDVNGDGVVNVSDVTMMVNHILGYNDENFIVENADVTRDGEVTVTDVTALVNLILGGNSITKIVVDGAEGLTFGGGGSDPARAGGNQHWDDEDDDSSWDNL